jgi:hypothetical protein
MAGQVRFQNFGSLGDRPVQRHSDVAKVIGMLNAIDKGMDFAERGVKRGRELIADSPEEIEEAEAATRTYRNEHPEEVTQQQLITMGLNPNIDSRGYSAYETPLDEGGMGLNRDALASQQQAILGGIDTPVTWETLTPDTSMGEMGYGMQTSPAHPLMGWNTILSEAEDDGIVNTSEAGSAEKITEDAEEGTMTANPQSKIDPGMRKKSGGNIQGSRN